MTPLAEPANDMRPMRADARQRREALVKAAAECFSESGYSVPLDEIADRAGVGRGTLYRNFKDRMALTLAIFEREVEQVGAAGDPDLPLDEAITAMVLRGARASALFTRLAAEMTFDETNLAAFKALSGRLEASLRPIVRKAHAEGHLRADIGTADLLMALRMIGGLLSPYKRITDERQYVADAFALLMKGLAPR